MISAAAPTDADSIATLLHSCWAATYGSFLSAETLARIAHEWHHPDVLRQQIADPQMACLVARTDSGVLVGVATVRLAPEGSVLSILRLYVHPGYQRHGVGTELLQSALATFPAVQRVELDVAEANPSGRAFWTKHGFHITGRTQTRIGDTILELVAMERRGAGACD